jgi:hypothetical protein
MMKTKGSVYPVLIRPDAYHPLGSLAADGPKYGTNKNVAAKSRRTAKRVVIKADLCVRTLRSTNDPAGLVPQPLFLSCGQPFTR